MDDDFKAPDTIGDRIYKVLKKKIILGEFKPGQKLTEIGTAKRFNVSPTPVREAFRKLSGEKYIIINSRKEVVVPSATHKEIKELFEIISTLDLLATRKAFKKISEKDIADLKGLTITLDKYSKKRDLSTYMVKNYELHNRLWMACGNGLLSNLLIELGERATFYNIQMYQDKEYRLNESCKAHLEIMEAIEKRDFSKAERILRSHWKDTWYFEKESGEKIKDHPARS